MEILTTNCWWSTRSSGPVIHLPWGNGTFPGGEFSGLFPARMILPTEGRTRFGSNIKAFASRNSVKKLRRVGEARKSKTLQTSKSPSDQCNGLEDGSSSGDDFICNNREVLSGDNMDTKNSDDFIRNNREVSSGDNMATKNSINIPSRSAVLQACTVTSGLIAALGLVIRQVSHIASMEGLPIHDCSTEVSFGFETWHLELITGLVILITSCRYVLLKTWPDFAESSEAANKQVLTSLQPLDYIVVAFLPGVSEELLFRGALLPLFGINWNSALVVAAIFGVLHLGSGRRYSFTVWATFVGFAYGYATIVSSSILVPMASHALNNLVGGILWRYTSSSSDKILD